ncbi:cellulase (glycosyl hydrolase family 5) [Motilibacter rhizosphaerae]|uniref:Cellulase (Glycosyl hydrolase family 5) n=1 Tax=Motilibacter rhizosphaerae TaxID=598652 RepID=A0A4Q7NGJ1_9ACTN|nr:cellulase family glycosylhydrolase [Motilibacter rhizosphaerae]RZS82942.1 cellulase (glycosyl hydrolase family 5) [Motilibacter rhizosphaerae]
MRLPRPSYRLPFRRRAAAAPTEGVVAATPVPPSTTRRAARAVLAAGLAVLVAALVAVGAGLAGGEPRGASASVESYSASPGWLTASGGPLAGLSPLPDYALPSTPPLPPPPAPSTPVVPVAVPPATTTTPPAAAPGTTAPAPGGTTSPGSSSPTPSAPSSGDVQPPRQTATTVPGTLFGIHDAELAAGKVPGVPVGEVRLWDTEGTTWRDLQPTSRTWDWTRLDTAVATAQKAGERVLLVLGQTPQWAASDPSDPAYASSTGYGPSVPRSVGSWTTYVKAVATRYKGRIADYEVWNEPNAKQFWTGSMKQLVPFAKAAYTTIKAVDPEATVTTPGFVVRRNAQRGDFTRYLDAGGAQWADVVNVHLYPEPKGTPEDMGTILDDVQTRLAKVGASSKPIWNTEVNFGLPTGGATDGATFSAATQAAYVARNFLVTQDLGVRRSYWYSWTTTSLPVSLVGKDQKPTAAAAAWTTIRSWMVGPGWRGCTTSDDGTWTCWVGSGRIVWNPSRTVDYPVPSGTRTAVSLTGASTPAKGGDSVKVGGSPLLLRTS